MAAALPLTLAAQAPSSSTPSGSSTSPSSSSTSSQSGSTNRSGSSSTQSSTTPSSSSTSSTRPSTGSTSSSTYGAAGSSSSSSAKASIRRLNEDTVERQFTAKDLIGKEVYDSAGKRIGEVKDILIASSANPQLASGLSHHGNVASTDASTRSGTTGTTRTASGSVGGVGASGSVTTSESGVGVSGTLGGTSSAGATSSHAQSMMGSMSENAVVVSYGGFLGAGNSMLRIPFNQLNYDASNRRITVNIAESELTSLPEATETSRSAAE